MSFKCNRVGCIGYHESEEVPDACDHMDDTGYCTFFHAYDENAPVVETEK